MRRALLAVPVLCAACAQPPTAELELASERVAAARAAEASVFAADPFHRAEAALANARTLSDEGDYLEAVHAAGDAVARADEASAAATMGRRVAQRDVDRCVSELEGLIAIAASRGAPADELSAFQERYVAVRAVVESGDLLGALDRGSRLKPELLAFEQRFRPSY